MMDLVMKNLVKRLKVSKKVGSTKKNQAKKYKTSRHSCI